MAPYFSIAVGFGSRWILAVALSSGGRSLFEVERKVVVTAVLEAKVEPSTRGPCRSSSAH